MKAASFITGILVEKIEKDTSAVMKIEPSVLASIDPATEIIPEEAANLSWHAMVCNGWKQGRPQRHVEIHVDRSMKKIFFQSHHSSGSFNRWQTVFFCNGSHLAA